jgi:glyoxylase-like metal-dependent hydrolase (beta-lactamase superfamily II)
MRLKKLWEQGGLEVLRLEVGSFGNNVYLVRDLQERVCVLIDASAEEEALWGAVGKDRLADILLTHTHMDHIQALEGIRSKSGAPVGIHPQEPSFAEMHPEISLFDGQRIPVGRRELEVLHTPGHTPGSVSFVLRPKFCFCGDTVFPGGPGKTWSPEDFQILIQSLEKKIYTLPVPMLLLPGHGEGITVENSRREYEGFRSRASGKSRFGEVLWQSS